MARGRDARGSRLVILGIPVYYVPVPHGSNWCALAVFHALFPGVSLGRLGNLSLGLLVREIGC